MKKNFTLYTFFICFLSLALLSNSGGRANSSSGNPGATGAPGDGNTTCGSSGCHNSGSFTVEQLIELINADGQVVEQYAPNAEYTVRVTNTSDGNPSGYGFQMITLLESDDSVYNAWGAEGAGVRKVGGSNGIDYAEHLNTSSSGVFEIMWTAPPKESGGVVFYTSGNAVNGNGSPSGDGSVTTSVTIAEELGASIEDIRFANLEIFPNPTVNISQVKSDFLLKGTMTITNLLGKTVQTISINSEQLEINLEGYQAGVYLVNFIETNGKSGFTRRLIKN